MLFLVRTLLATALALALGGVLTAAALATDPAPAAAGVLPTPAASTAPLLPAVDADIDPPDAGALIADPPPPADPPSPADTSADPATTQRGPRIELWWGEEMQVGVPGLLPPDVHIMGRVTDANGVASISYRLNGAPPVPMGIGPDARRLAEPGDFNANIPVASLNPGPNTVVLRAVDNLGNESAATVTVTYTPGLTWPFPYAVNWSSASTIADVVQPIDGRWDLRSGGVRTTSFGYDRLLSVGDTTWGSFEAVMPITVHQVDPLGTASNDGGAGVGFIPHWQGHIQQPGFTVQPPFGFRNQLGALTWFRWRTNNPNLGRLEIRDSNARLVAVDLDRSFELTLGVPFLLRLRAETGGADGARYSVKAWPQGTPEPVGFPLVFEVPPPAPEVAPPPSTGSLLLVAHHVDATFGDLTVTRLTAGTPSISPQPGTYAGLTKVSMTVGNEPLTEIRYTLDGSEPTETSPLYTEPFLLTQSLTVKARAFRPGFEPSSLAQTPFTITPAPTRVTNGLTALYTFDEGGGQVIRDSSPAGQAGQPLDLRVVSGSPTWLPEGGLRLSNRTVITSTTSAARFTDAARQSRSFAIETWLDPVSTEQLATVVDVGSGNGGATGARNVALTQRNQAYEMAIRRSTTTRANGAPFFTANGTVRPELHHVVFQRRSTFQVELWIDGELAASASRNGTFDPWDGAFRLSVGGDHTGADAWQGDLRLLALYGRSLTPTEIARNYRSGPGESGANRPPVVSAGADVTIVHGETAQLTGSATDDGRPSPPATLTTTWRLESGPGTVTFADPSDPATTATFSAPGDHRLELSASDGERTTVDQVTVTVIAAGSVAAAPLITPAPGVYGTPVAVTMTSTIPGAEIRYTTDGTDPTATSTPYTGPFVVSTTTEIRARVFRTGLVESPVVTASYQIEVTARVSDGLRALYEFNETSGSRARDTSGVGSPLHLTIANAARTTWVDGGLQIRSATRLTSTDASKVTSAVRASGEVTVEGWIQPADTAAAGRQVMTISGSPTARNLALTQSATSYDWFLRSRNTNARGEPPLSMGPVATTTTPQHVAVTRSADGVTRTYLNGVEVASASLPGDLRNWVNTYRITVGAEANGTQPWLGTIFSLAIYSRALTPTEILQNYAVSGREIPAG